MLVAARELAQRGREAGLRLKALLEADFESKEIRPALGWAGLKSAAEQDEFIRKMLSIEKFVEVNQTPWLKSHSGMQEPQGELGEMLREKSYWDAIVRRMLEDGGGFGKYPPLPPGD